MLKNLVSLIVLLHTFNAFAAAAVPARVAILANNPTIASAGDLLTAQLSNNEQLHLLERGEIEKILREQKLSSAGLTGNDALKLGRILGADGLLLIDVSKQGTNSFLNARLVAVKQGAVLDFLQTELPLKDAVQFSQGAARHLEPYLSKLTVLEKDAVPISILNLRSAASSKESAQLDRGLTALLINRLMREREIFILERRRMDALSSEKELNADASSFWSGSYLLEGTIDKNGFSKEQVTLSAKMSPPNGGVPTQIELAGKRTDLPGVVDELAKKILQALQKSSSAPEWNPAEEAAQFFEEAKWALRWGMPVEAQSAADSAWALGRRDLETALVRVQSYRAGCAYSGQVYLKHYSDESNGEGIEWTTILQQPDPRKLEALLVALNLYYEFSQTIPVNELKWDSKWCLLGIDVLNAAGTVLQHFHFDPKSQAAVADRLSDARALARSVSKWLLQSPSVREIYWLNGRTVSPDTFNRWFERGSVQAALAANGRFWQERPEACIAHYRELMSGEGYHRVRKYLLNRDDQNPLLCAWNPGDRRRAGKLWENFLKELAASTNVAWRIEEKLQHMADADPNKAGELEKAFNALYSAIQTNRDSLARANAEVFKTYDVTGLISEKCSQVQTPEKQRIKKRLYPEFDQELRSIERDFWRNMEARLEEQKNAVAFARQQEYLRQKTPYNAGEFMRMFSGAVRYSPEQARELQPLLASYKADLESQLNKKTGRERALLQSGVSQIRFLENRLNRTLVPPPRTARVTNQSPAPMLATSKPAAPHKTELPSDVIVVKRFFRIPAERIGAEKLRVVAHRRTDSNVLLDLRYERKDEFGRPERAAGVMIWNAKNEDFVAYPPTIDGRDYVGSLFGEEWPNLHFELFNGSLFFADWNGIHRCDLRTRRWQDLKIPMQSLAQLFSVEGRLFATTGESILELLDDGQSTRLLASRRRRPTVTALDALENFGKPIIFPGPNHSIRTWIGKVYTWTGKDWSEGETLPPGRLEIFSDAALFGSSIPYQGNRISLLPYEADQSEYCVFEPPQQFFGTLSSVTNRLRPGDGAAPRWQSLDDISLLSAGRAAMHRNLYFFLEHLEIRRNSSGPSTFQEKDGRHADLICFDRDDSKPFVVPLKFDLQQGEFSSREIGSQAGSWNGAAQHWLMFVGDNLILGQMDMPGFWLIPRTEIEAAVARQKDMRRSKELKESTAVAKRHRILLARYDTNRDGQFSPEEKEKLFRDPEALEELWPAADLNRNGLLDRADQLSLFDCNENGQCEPNELELLDKAAEIVGREMRARFDINRDGVFSEEEFNKIPQPDEDNRNPGHRFASMSWAGFDTDQSRTLDKSELERWLCRGTRISILSKIRDPMTLHFAMMSTRPGAKSEAQQRSVNAKLISALEKLWQQNKVNGTR